MGFFLRKKKMKTKILPTDTVSLSLNFMFRGKNFLLSIFLSFVAIHHVSCFIKISITILGIDGRFFSIFPIELRLLTNFSYFN